MQKKTIFSSVIMLLSFGLFVQNSTAQSNVKVTNQEVNFVLDASAKVVTPDSIITNTQEFVQTVIPEIKTEPTPSKFKPVPLVGETDYYGNNHKTIIDYTTNYMKSFGGRIGKGANKDQIFATMDKILESHEIPKELKYLAVIESALNGNARSPVGAVGYWQFMAPTARDMGLVVNKNRDDRKNLNRSTHAAAKYLSYLYNQLDDWLLVVAAYNSGPRPVINAIKRTGKNDFWSIKRYLPRETQNHVLAFIATATIMEKLDQYIEPGLPTNFDWASLNQKAEQFNQPENPLLKRFGKEELQKMAIIRINTPMSFEKIASILSIDIRLLNRWNYDYMEYIKSYQQGASTYNLKIPKEKLDSFIEKKTRIERESRF